MLCLLIFSLFKWVKNKKSVSFLFFLFCVCSGFRLLPPELHMFKMHDYALVYIFFIFVYSFLKGRKIINISNDIVGKLVIVLLIYWTLLFFGTLLFTSEQPILAFQAFRFRLLFLVYFVVKDMSIKQKENVMYYLFGIILFASILYILQPLGIHIYQGGADETLFSNEKVRYRNAPLFVQLFIILLLTSNFITNNKLKFIALSVFLIALIIPMSRTPMIMLSLVLIVYMILMRKYKILFKLVLISFFIVIMCWPVLSYRFSSTNTLGDIESAINIEKVSMYDPEDSEGSFTFRIAMLYERIIYLLDTNKVLCGCGFIHEQSSYTRSLMNFRIGTISEINGSPAITFIETPDMTWLTILMRTGIIGLIIILILYFNIFISLYKSKKIFFKSVSLWVIYLLLVSFSGDTLGFSAIYNYVLLFVFYTLHKSLSAKNLNNKLIIKG